MDRRKLLLHDKQFRIVSQFSPKSFKVLDPKTPTCKILGDCTDEDRHHQATEKYAED